MSDQPKNNVTSIADYEKKVVFETVNELIEKLDGMFEISVHNLSSRATRMKLSPEELSTIFGMSVASYFIKVISTPNLLNDSFDDSITICENLKDPLLLGFQTYINGFADEIRKAKQKN